MSNELKDPKNDAVAPTGGAFRYIDVDIGGTTYKIIAETAT
jgi:hypothetical protein